MESLEENQRRLKELFDVIRAAGRPVVLTHVNPDPDCLASALGMQAILKHEFGGTVPIVSDGIVGRAENKALVRHLKIDLVRPRKLTGTRYRCAVLVDAQPYTGNIPALPEGVKLVATFDHHPLRKGTGTLPFCEVRTRYGSTSTLVYEFLKAANVPITKRLATALFYGVKSDTRDLWRRSTPEDEAAYVALFAGVDRKLLSAIEHPTLPAEYFGDLQHALASATGYGSVVIADLAQIHYPDFVAEIADFLLRGEDFEWSLAVGSDEDALLFSIRARQRTSRGDAGRIAQRLALPLGGTAGGHGTMAGGRIPIVSESQEATVRSQLHEDFLRMLRATGSKPRSLVS